MEEQKNRGDRIAKGLDRFLLAEDLVEERVLVRQWMADGGISDHSPIMLALSEGLVKPPGPFKINSS